MGIEDREAIMHLIELIFDLLTKEKLVNYYHFLFVFFFSKLLISVSCFVRRTLMAVTNYYHKSQINRTLRKFYTHKVRINHFKLNFL